MRNTVKLSYHLSVSRMMIGKEDALFKARPVKFQRITANYALRKNFYY